MERHGLHPADPLRLLHSEVIRSARSPRNNFAHRMPIRVLFFSGEQGLFQTRHKSKYLVRSETGLQKWRWVKLKLFTRTLFAQALVLSCLSLYLFKIPGQGIELASVAELYENDLLFSYFFQQITTDSVWFGLTFEVVGFSFFL